MTKTSRLFPAVPAVLAATLILGACSVGSGQTGAAEPESGCKEQTNASPSPGKHVTLDFWMLPFLYGPKGEGGKGKPTDWGDAVIKEFEAAHPNVTVKQELLSYEGYQQKIVTSLAGGTPPDVVMSVGSLGGVEKYARLGALMPIDCFETPADRADFTDVAKGSMQFRGHDYAWPWEALVSGIVVNTDLFDKAGATDQLPLDRPHLDWSFDQFKQAAKAVSDPPHTYGYEVHGKDGAFYNYLWAVNNGAPMTDADFTKYTWDAKAAAGLKFLADLPSEGLAPGGAAGLSFGDAYNLFLQGKIAMFPAFGLSTILSDIQDTGHPFDVGIVAPPHGPGAQTKVWTNASGFMVFKHSDPYRVKLAMELGKLLTSTENNRIVARALEVFPARRSASDAIAGNTNLAPFRKIQRFADSNFTQGYGLISETAWDNNFQAILTGRLSTEEAVAALDAEVAKALRAGTG